MLSDRDSDLFSNRPPLILFSGLGADSSIFLSQSFEFPQLRVPRWIPPREDELLPNYCERLAKEIAIDGPCWIGGASFGGIVALEMARLLKPQGVILIGSVRNPSELPWKVKGFRWAQFLIPWIPVKLLQTIAGKMFVAKRSTTPQTSLMMQFANSNPEVLKWSLRQLLRWNTAPAVECPVFRIHGTRDWMIPLGKTRADQVVVGGGHVLSLTHPRQVNAFLRDCGVK